MYAISSFAITSGHRQPAVQPRPHRVLLRYWGFSAQEAAGLLPDLPGLGDRLHWSLDEQATPKPDLVIHLVDATRLSGVSGGARWNAMGPVEAMNKASVRGISEVALVLGSAHHLPHVRRGCWILSGARSLAQSIDILVRTMIEPLLDAPMERPWSIHELARTHALCVLSQETGLDRDVVSRRVMSAVSTALNVGHVPPMRMAIAADASILDDLISLNPVMRERLRLFRRRPSCRDLSAEVLVAYRWPMPMPEVDIAC